MGSALRRFATASMAVCLLAACDTSAPSLSPAAFADRPGIQLDTTWTALNGQWTFTGNVDPNGAPTGVVLEIGPGPITARVFDTQVTVADHVAAAMPLTITTTKIPNIPQICVRFTASNSVGTSWSTPLCFPHDLPTAPPPGAPTVAIDSTFTVADGKWTFTADVNPHNVATDLVLDTGTGPATSPHYTKHIPVTTGLDGPARVMFATSELPASGEVCVRFTVTNSIGTASSDPLCFQR
jgi:hypothetical protein